MITYIENFAKEVNFNDFNDLKWNQVPNTPRKEYFMAEKSGLTYTYDGTEFEYVSNEFNNIVKQLLSKLNLVFDTEYNVCFLNRYEDEKNHLGWHSDDSIGMDLNHPIAVISFGAERKIFWKEKHQKGELDDFQKVLLKDKSLFVMPKHFQRFFLHKIPKHDRPCGPRISLTFRKYIQ